MNRSGALFLLTTPIIALAIYFSYDYFLSTEVKISGMTEMTGAQLDLSLTTIDNEQIQLGEIKDKIVLLNFWASWCAPCAEEFPSFIRLIEEFKGQIILVAISSDSHVSSIITFFKKNRLESQFLKVVSDPEGTWSRTLSVKKIPETFILREGVVQGKSEGYSRWDSPYWKKKLTHLLSQ